jgi:hypothetical protein
MPDFWAKKHCSRRFFFWGVDFGKLWANFWTKNYCQEGFFFWGINFVEAETRRNLFRFSCNFDGRVARFFLVQNTKTLNIYQITPDYTNCP